MEWTASTGGVSGVVWGQRVTHRRDIDSCRMHMLWLFYVQTCLLILLVLSGLACSFKFASVTAMDSAGSLV